MHQTLIDYIRTELAGNPSLELDPADDLLNSGLIDSMGVMRLIAFIEEQFSLKIPPQDLTIENFETVNAIAEYLERAQASA